MLIKHTGALRGSPGSAFPPQPEPNATELPSCAHISARARAAQRRRRRRWWRGVARRARRPGLKARSFAHSAVRPPQRPAPRPLRARPSRVAQGQRGGRHAYVGRELRRLKMARATTNTFTLPSSAAPSTSSATSCATSCAASFTCLSFKCRPRQRGGRHACTGRGSRRWKMARAMMNTFTLPSSAVFNTSSATSCAAPCTCSSFTCHLRASVGGGVRVLGVGSAAGR